MDTGEPSSVQLCNPSILRLLLVHTLPVNNTLQVLRPIPFLSIIDEHFVNSHSIRITPIKFSSISLSMCKCKNIKCEKKHKVNYGGRESIYTAYLYCILARQTEAKVTSNGFHISIFIPDSYVVFSYVISVYF